MAQILGEKSRNERLHRTGGALYREIYWLISDHLGTPRLIAERTGKLEGLKRSDYLPYGESANALGGRSVAQGYAGESVRQGFTLYERDDETGLDYAQARYYASGMGRFISVDPLMASGKAENPQTWNRYAYSYNNPLRFTDPSGMVAGDFYNELGEYLGTDGKDDDKAYVVTDTAEAARFRSDLGISADALQSAIELPSLKVRQAIGAAVERSNSPTVGLAVDGKEDPVGGFHEEGLIAGIDKVTGEERVVNALPGGYVDPSRGGGASVDVGYPANSQERDVLKEITVKAHIHPAGSKGGARFMDVDGTQKPSSPDVSQANQTSAGSLTPNGTSIVVGARENRVYIYEKTGNRKDCNCVAKFPLGKFLTIGTNK